MQPTTTPYQKQVIPAGPGDYDALLNGRYIGSFPTSALAWAELDRVAYEDARHSGAGTLVEECTDQLSSANPLIPFGVAGGPDADLSALTPAAICRAAEAVADFYERHAVVVQRVLSALDLALLACTEQQLPPDTRTVRVREHGDLTVRGSKTYWISDHGCTCPDYRHLVYGQKYVGSGAEGGLCKHTLCREILRLAQACLGVFDAEAGNKTAIVSLCAGQLARALTALLKAEPTTITIAVAFARARLSAGDVQKEIVSEQRQGWGIRTLVLDGDGAQQITQALRTFAKTHAATPLSLMLDVGEAEVAIFGEGFHTTCPAHRIDEP